MSYVEDIAAYLPQSEAEAAEKEIILDYIRRYPDTILLRENRAAHMTASGFILSADGKWVLMAHHNIYRVWAWTGGHADGEGDLLKVALKEAEEETGLILTDYRYRGIVTFVSDRWPNE